MIKSNKSENVFFLSILQIDIYIFWKVPSLEILADIFTSLEVLTSLKRVKYRKRKYI